MFAAWLGCAGGLALGLYGCALIARAARRPRRAAWNADVERTARATLAVAQRLARRDGQRSDAIAAQLAAQLDELAERFDALADQPPAGRQARTLVPVLLTAARGTRAEAARLRDVIVVDSDRRTFVAAL